MPPKVPLQRAPAERAEAAQHLSYEIKMVVETAERLLLRQGQLERLEENVFLESFCVHVRALSEFLLDKGVPPKGTDVLPSDLTKQPWSPKPLRGHPLWPVYDRINKQIAHLTYGRSLVEQAKTWPLGEILLLLMKELALYLDAVDERWFGGQIDVLAGLLRKGQEVASQLHLTGATASTESSLSEVSHYYQVGRWDTEDSR